MSPPLEQPWKQTLKQLAESPEDGGVDLSPAQSISETTEEMCPGGDRCPETPHAIGSSKGCAFKSDIGAVFMNCSG